MILKLHSFRNAVDFAIRSRLRWGRKRSDASPVPQRDQILQREFEAFVSLFPWRRLLERFPFSDSLRIIDIGARNFAFGPVLDQLFLKYGYSADITGIEIDAFRLLSGFYTRQSYGDFYSRKMRKGKFVPDNFLDWKMPVDIAFLLNPFVSEEPLVSWGLPLRELKPSKLFEHAYQLLKQRNGFLVLSCPSPEELEIAEELAQTAGFIPLERAKWNPPKQSVQQKPRLGIIYSVS